MMEYVQKRCTFCSADKVAAKGTRNYTCGDCEDLHVTLNAVLTPDQVGQYAALLFGNVPGRVPKTALVLITLTEEWLAPSQITARYKGGDANGRKPEGSAFVSDPLKKLMRLGLALPYPGGGRKYCISPKGRQVKDYLRKEMCV